MAKMARKRFSGSPITSRQQELSQQEQAVRREMADLERLISEAPQLAEQALERQREQRWLLANTRRSAFDSPDVLHDGRHNEDPAVTRPRRPRRAQRRAARMRLAVMLMAVMVAGAVVLFLVMHLIKHL